MQGTDSTIARAVHGSIMGKEFALIVAQSVFVHGHRLFAFKLYALHHSFVRELSTRMEVFEYQSAVVGDQSASRPRVNECQNILDLALQSTVSIDVEVSAYDLA